MHDSEARERRGYLGREGEGLVRWQRAARLAEATREGRVHHLEEERSDARRRKVPSEREDVGMLS